MATVLVVDPNHRARALAVGALSSISGVSVIAAGSVDEARAILSTMRPHLVMAEFAIDEETGVDVLTALNRLLPEVPVIVTTTPETLVTTTRAKVHTLTRPFGFEALRDAVSENLSFDAFWDALVAAPTAPRSSPFTPQLEDSGPRETMPFGLMREDLPPVRVPSQSSLPLIAAAEPSNDSTWEVESEFEKRYREGVEALLDRRHADAYAAFVTASKLGCSTSLVANLERLRGLGFGR